MDTLDVNCWKLNVTQVRVIVDINSPRLGSLWQVKVKYNKGLGNVNTIFKTRQGTQGKRYLIRLYNIATVRNCIKVYMTQKIFCLRGLSKYRRIAFFFLKYLFSFDVFLLYKLGTDH